MKLLNEIHCYLRQLRSPQNHLIKCQQNFLGPQRVTAPCLRAHALALVLYVKGHDINLVAYARKYISTYKVDHSLGLASFPGLHREKGRPHCLRMRVIFPTFWKFPTTNRQFRVLLTYSSVYLDIIIILRECNALLASVTSRVG